MNEYLKYFIGIVVIIGIILFGVNALSRAYMNSVCTVFEQESNRETKLVSYGYMNYDCLTPLDNGKWISAQNLRGE